MIAFVLPFIAGAVAYGLSLAALNDAPPVPEPGWIKDRYGIYHLYIPAQ